MTDGWVLVPREPTEAEIKAVHAALTGPAPAYTGKTNTLDRLNLLARHVASAAIAAAPPVDGWQTIETAPRDAVILLYGFLDPHPNDRELHSGLHIPKRVTGYWDSIDNAWSPIGSTWTGPWFNPTHWMPLPQPPNNERTG